MTPPDATGGEPDFSEMSPEEAMNWLESLAKRQGAKEEELTTEAGLDIPEPPPDVIIDEPGYTPYDAKSGKPKPAESKPTTEAQPPPPEPEPEPEPVPEAELAAEPPSASGAEEEMEDAIMSDPMAWLESLAKRQGAKVEELTTAADLDVPEPPPDTVIDEPGYTPFDPSGRSRAPEPAPEPEPEPAPEAAPEEVDLIGADEPVEEVSPEELMMADPMAWLESLAKRQGVSEQELMTAADLSVPEPPPDTVVDEPGYTPFDSKTGKPKAAEPEPSELPSAEPVAEEIPDAEPVAEEVAPAEPEPDLDLSADDLFGDIEPAELPDWLKPTEPSIDLADLEETPEEPSPAVGEEDGLGWLQGLAEEEAQQDEPALDFLNEASEVAEPDEEVVPDEEDTQAWLEQQLDSFIDHREQTEADEGGPEDMEPAVPGELPDWLAQQMPAETQAEAGELPDWLGAVAEEADVSEEGANAWLAGLAEDEEAEASLDLSAEVLEEADILPSEEALPAGEPSELPAWLSELQESVEAPAAEQDESLDWLAEAQAMTDAEALDIESEDITAWLREQEEAPLASTPEAEAPDMSWLEEEAPAEEETDLSWLEEGGQEADISWLEAVAAEEEFVEPVAEPPAPEPAVPEPAPSPPTTEPVEFAPPPTPRPTARIPPAEVIEPEPPSPLKIEASQEEVQQWLSQARARKEDGDFDASMDHYERLVLAEEQIDDLVSDLEGIARQLATNVRVRRLLGDVYMRQNRLQEALDIYRGALDQL